MFSEEEIKELERIFMPRRECQNNLTEISERMAKYITKLSVIESQQKTILWVLTAVGGGVISIVLKLFLGG